MTRQFSNTLFDSLKGYLFWVLILAGFLIRLSALGFNGIFDMTTYQEWGLNSLIKGLDAAYQGIYFPFQYQIFEFGSWLSKILNLQYFTSYKIVNLFFDIGNLLMLFLILKEFKISKYYLLVYWLHPWFLLVFSQGYCDFHFTFFILCSLYFTIKESTRNYLISGLFLGFALHMKPQVQVIALAFFIYSCYIFIKKRDLKLFHIFIFPLIIFLDYSLYFLVMEGNPFVILRDFFDFPEKAPLNANFLNAWFPLAYYLKSPSAPIHSVNDNLVLMNISMRSIAMLTLLVLMFFYIRKFIRTFQNQDKNDSLILIALFSTMVFSFIMTAAHENHLFLATVLMVPLLGKIKNVLITISIHSLLLLQCVNLYGYYGYGEKRVFEIFNLNYSYEIAFILSLIAFFAFMILSIFLLTNKPNLLIINSEKSI